MFLHGRSRRIGLAAAGLAALGLMASACSSNSSGGGGGTSSGKGGGSGDSTLVAFTGQSDNYQINFNPYSPTRIGGDGTINESLFFINQVDPDAKETPLLGTEHSWSPDGKKLSITLRDGVKWSDGQPFTADDVVFTFDLIARTPTINTNGYKGTAKAIDPTHVEITFPTASFVDGPQLLGRTPIMPRHIWKDVKDAATETNPKPIGTGPYLLGDFKPQAYTLTANPTYWGGEVAVKKVRYIVLSGNQAGAAAVKAGQIDWMTSPVPDMANIEKNYPGYKGSTTPIQQAALMTCSNPELGCKGPQTDVAVRKAIYYAIDRTQINALAFQNTASEISPGFVLRPRDQAYASSKLTEQVAPMTAQPEKAIQILEAAGYTKGADGIYAKDGQKLSLTVKVVTGWNDYITAVDVMAQQAKKAGIELVTSQSSWNDWSQSRGEGSYQLLIDSLYNGPTADPYYCLQYFFSTETTAPVGKAANPNWVRFSNPQVDAALAALRQIDMKDKAKRQPYFDTIQTEIEKDLPYIPILTGGTTSVYHDAKFTGWPTKDNLYAFFAIWSRGDDAEIFRHLKPVG